MKALTGVLCLLCGSVLSADAQLAAFPGAEGFGKFATGARGGAVYHVTNLNDSGPGSFRDAVSVSGRTVVFDVGGVIDYQTPRYAPKPNVTIAGQTAPGDGVTIYGNGLSFSGANNAICRFIRVREGINGDSGTDAMGIANGHDMIFDHISDSWGRDETFSVNGSITNISFQNLIISQGLQGHSAGGLIQADGGVSILRCLYIDNDTRNPKVKFVNEFVNNVVCNWETIGYNMGGDSAGDSYANAFNNYFMAGQASSSSAFGGGNLNFHIYATNNWYDGNKNGVLDGSVLPIANYGSMDLQSVPFPYPITTASAPLTALKRVISEAGNSFKRDYVDELMMTQLTSWGTLGGTITSELVSPMTGPGIIKNGPAYTDTDQDGMPDFWENGTGSNPNVANNNDPSPSGSGYTRLEDYLNWLAEPHGIALTDTNVSVDLRLFTRGWSSVRHSPTYSVSNPTNGTVTLSKGFMANFIPSPGLNGAAGFQFTVNDADGEPFTRQMNLFFTPLAQTFSPVWHGDGTTNNWNVLGDFNWFDTRSLLYPFHTGDAVTFDDSGSTAPAVALIGSLQPSAVAVNATKNYTFSGSGSLDGAMALSKTNSGTLTINTTNGYTGPTTVSNGTLLVNGALLQSAVTVRSSGTVGGNGRLGNGLTAQSGAAISPGNGVGSPGKLTVTNTLSAPGGVMFNFDLSNDPAGLTKTNDQIIVGGTLSLGGTNTIQITLLNGPLVNGHYTLIKYTTLVGGLANFTLLGANGVLTNPPGEIAIHVDNTRPPANLVWAGDGVNNIWDAGTNANWINTNLPDWFYSFDSVLFADNGSTNPPIALSGTLLPAAVTVNTTNNYTFAGSGKISGTVGLTKTNSGTLTINSTNDFTGPTIIGGGVLAVSRITNSALASSIGAAGMDPFNLVFYGSTLRYTGGSVNSDRGATLNASGGTFDITGSGTTLTWNGTNIGSGALTKVGPGTVTLTAANSFSGGTIISNGTLALFGPSGGATTTANNYSLGSGGVTFYGGTLKLFGGGLSDAAAGYGTFSRPMIVPAGQTATVLTPARYTMSSSLTGSGTLNLEVNYVRGALSGNWSAFTGLINVTARTSSGGSNEFRFGNSTGYGGATIILNDNVVMDRSGGATTVNIGALGGTAGSWVGPGNQSSSGTTYSIGWNNTDATFSGTIKNDGTTTFVKVGTGRWTLTGANSWSGGLSISNGTVLANNTTGSAVGSGAVAVFSGGVLGGTGSVGAPVTVASGGAIAPGASIGTLTINSSLTLANGSLLNFELGATNASDKLIVNGAVALGGTLNITNLSGFGAGTYTLITYSGALSGSLPAIGAKPAGYGCVVNTNTAGQVRLVVTVTAQPRFSSIMASGPNLSLAGTNGTSSGDYYVLTSTNVTLPFASWGRFATNQFDSAGAFGFTTPIDPAQPGRFFILQLP